MKKLLLIDGSNLMFRAYYATAYSGNLMKNSHGQYTNAVYGMINMLNVILKEDFTHCLVAFDMGKETFRHKAYEDYKAKRTPMPDEFRSQLDLIKDVPQKLGMLVYETKALEADDIIGTIAHKYYDDFDAIEILSNDKDLFQLLNHKVSMRMSKRGLEPERVYTEQSLQDEYNLTPDQIPDFKGLMGDASDNLPGIPGVGEKTALKLLHEYGDIQTLLKNLNELKGKLKERVENHGEEALRWRDLATVKIDAELDISLKDLAYEGYDTETLKSFYEKLEFHSFIRRINKQEEPEKPAVQPEDVAVLREDEAIKPYLKDDATIILECFGDNYHFAEILGLAILTEKGACFVPGEHLRTSDAIREYLEDPKKKKSVFDAKATYVALAKEDIYLAGVVFDLLLAAYVLNPSNTKEDFKVVVANFDYDDVPYLEEVYGKGAKQSVPDVSVYIDYAVKKTLAIRKLKPTLLQHLSNNGQQSLFEDIELPLAMILGKMEQEGVTIDMTALDAFGESLDEEIGNLEQQIHEDAGTKFNIGSPKQLGEVLFETLNLPALKKTKTGYSTSIDVLKRLAHKHQIIPKLMRYRTITKLKNAYVKGLKEAVHEDGKIHTIYKQAFTQTGRLSSIEPNLQTIPIRTEIGRDLRKVFIPEKNYKLFAADYSQIELRILAHMAQEETLIKAFENDEDIHTITGKEVLNKKELTANERRIAKAVNFGIIYGQSAWGLSEELGISNQDAKQFIKAYYEKFPGIMTFMENVVEDAKEKGYVETLYKRRRYIPELNSKIYAQRELGKRTAMNAPLQGSAADIIKIAMVDIDHALKKKNLKSRMILQIHDELVFNVHPDEAEAMKKLVRDTMENCVQLAVPLTVSVAMGDNLDEAK